MDMHFYKFPILELYFIWEHVNILTYNARNPIQDYEFESLNS